MHQRTDAILSAVVFNNMRSVNCFQKRNDLLKDSNKELAPTAIVEGTTVIRSRRQLSQIIDTTLLKCYLKVINLSMV